MHTQVHGKKCIVLIALSHVPHVPLVKLYSDPRYNTWGCVSCGKENVLPGFLLEEQTTVAIYHATNNKFCAWRMLYRVSYTQHF